MGYTYTFFNHTKKQYVEHKKLSIGFECEQYLLEYLALSSGCTIEIVGENEAEHRILDLEEYKDYVDKSWCYHPDKGIVDNEDFDDFFSE